LAVLTGLQGEEHVASDFRSDQTASLGEVAKAAFQLDVARFRKSNLSRLTLRAAYLNLGRDIVAAGRFRDEFPDLIAQITATQQIRNCLAGIEARTFLRKEEPLLRRLAESAYTRHGAKSGPEPLVRAVADCLSKMDVLDREIDRLSRVGKGSALTPRRFLAGAEMGIVLIAVVLITIMNAGRPVPLVVFLAFLPIGLYLLLKKGGVFWAYVVKLDALMAASNEKMILAKFERKRVKNEKLRQEQDELKRQQEQEERRRQEEERRRQQEQEERRRQSVRCPACGAEEAVEFIGRTLVSSEQRPETVERVAYQEVPNPDYMQYDNFNRRRPYDPYLTTTTRYQEQVTVIHKTFDRIF
jgi:hypothetical protein